MDEHNKNIVDQFTKQALPFAEKMTARSGEELLQAMLRVSAVKSNDTVLDVACGPGLVACAFARVAREVAGIDLTPAMIERARLLQEKEKLSWWLMLLRTKNYSSTAPVWEILPLTTSTPVSRDTRSRFRQSTTK